MTVCNVCDGDSRYYVGDIGTELIVDTCVDITTATLAQILVQKPDGTTDTWTGAVYDTTKIKYVIQSGDWDQEGQYRYQAYVEMPSWRGKGDTVAHKIYDSFA